jgi:hypothetical protein
MTEYRQVPVTDEPVGNKHGIEISSIKLLPCPFCGDELYVWEQNINEGGFSHTLLWAEHDQDDCVLRGNLFGHDEFDAWNRRAAAPKPDDSIEGHWWCPLCLREVAPACVTYEENHDGCGQRVEWIAAPKPDELARLRCPFCAHECQTGSIGAVYCGPHKLNDGAYHPAVRMVRVKENGG